MHAANGGAKASQSTALEQVFCLVTPIETDPEIVHLCIHGLLAGKIKLSFKTVEPVLVLANAVGVRNCKYRSQQNIV